MLEEFSAWPCSLLADHGAGKSHLGFILYDLYFIMPGRGHIYGIETRADLVENPAPRPTGWVLAACLSESVGGRIDRCGRAPDRIDIVTALHACDTATDDAIASACKAGSRHGHRALLPGRGGIVLRSDKALQLGPYAVG